MYLRKLMITTMLSILMLGTTGVSANQSSTITVNNMPMKNKYYCQRMGGILTVEQQGELRNIMDNLHEQLTPLIKKKMALKMQLKGIMATPKTEWADVSKLVDQLNENNAKMTLLIARTQFAAFQKLGVFIPRASHRFNHHGWRKGQALFKC